MAEIEWSRLASGTFEDMVACLLSHQNDKVRRIDGSGGDGGRDCQFEAPDGLHLYEMKGFPGGRVGASQRRQVERSLKRAAQLHPAEWTLITPVDPTPAELKWFAKVAKTVPSPIDWRGKTWLNTEFAQRPFIADYYLGTTRDEVINLLLELGKEEAGLANGVPDAMSRVETLVKRANELDPHYRFKIASDGTTTSVTIHPAYPGAEVDRPITVKAQFQFDTKTEAGRAKHEEFERAFDFGIPAEFEGDFVPEISVDAPAGLGGTFEKPSVSMGPGQPASTDPVDLVFTVSDPEGKTVAALTVQCVPNTAGRRGVVFKGTDRGGYINSDVTVDTTDSKYNIKVRAKWESFVPHDFAPVARFLSAYHAPNSVVVALADGRVPSDPLECGPGLDMPGWMLDFVMGLAVIQASAGIVREVSGVTPQDIVNTMGGVALLRGGEVPAPWTTGAATVRASASLETRKQLVENVIQMVGVVDAPFELAICGTVYPIGRRHASRTVCRVAQSDIEALLADELVDDLRVTLVPDPDEPSAMIRLVD
jgi:hypothetical protein